MNDYELHLGDCLDVMRGIPDGSIDMILCDLPYGTTACAWDTVIPFAPLWEQYLRVIKPNGAVVLFGSEPFSSALRMSNLGMFKYDWVWDKKGASSALNCNHQPLKTHEIISVFSVAPSTYARNGSMRYIPQGLSEYERVIDRRSRNSGIFHTDPNKRTTQRFSGYPKSILSFGKAHGLHPTQKPVALCEYLIRTYTNEGETVLDNCMGSGTTGVACYNTGRRFVGIEKERKYFDIAKGRIESIWL